MKSTASFAHLVAIWLLVLHHPSVAFSPTLLVATTNDRQGTTTFCRSPKNHCLFAASQDNNESSNNRKGPQESEEDFQRRMAVVRSLQMSFYKSTVDDATFAKSAAANAATNAATNNATTTSTSTLTTTSSYTDTTCTLEESTGRLINLPLWRVQWWEVPGRSNVLNVHEPIYTNLFEKILRGPKPHVFGHLYLEGGTTNLRSEEPRFQLHTWRDAAAANQKQHDESATVGTLMHISDFRRLADGRLLLLVHAMERFVITSVQQTLPYSIVHAQMLPDEEEVDAIMNITTTTTGATEAQRQGPRAWAVQESVRFHEYEYGDHKLPLVQGEVESSDVMGSALAQVLPYCPFHKTLPPPEPLDYQQSQNIQNDSSFQDTKLSLESRLLQTGILQAPLHDPDFVDRSTWTADELEVQLWLTLSKFLATTKTPVSPVLLGLLPHNVTWPSKTTTTTTSSSFLLEAIVQELQDLPVQQPQVDHDFVRVAPDYPAHRRQKRLSFGAAHLLETMDTASRMRETLLKTPSTKQRLRWVLEGFDRWQEQKWGEFQ